MARKLTTFIAALASVGLLSAAPALAGDEFQGDSAATWSARSLMMANVLGQDGQADVASIGAALGTSCDGITGEQVKHEYGKVPKWALTSQLVICSGYDGWAHKYGGSKGPCQMMEKGLKDLENARKPGVPADVAAAAEALRQTATNLLEAGQASKHGCKL